MFLSHRQTLELFTFSIFSQQVGPITFSKTLSLLLQRLLGYSYSIFSIFCLIFSFETWPLLSVQNDSDVGTTCRGGSTAVNPYWLKVKMYGVQYSGKEVLLWPSLSPRAALGEIEKVSLTAAPRILPFLLIFGQEPLHPSSGTEKR